MLNNGSIGSNKRTSSSLNNSESNSLWATYYSQYLECLFVLLGLQKGASIDNIFLPLCFLTAHYLELWIKTIEENFGIGNTIVFEAKLLQGHEIEKLLDKLKDDLSSCGAKVLRDIDKVKSLYSELSSLKRADCPLSEAMRYPIRIKDSPTLSATVTDSIEWQRYDFDYNHYYSVIEEIVMITWKIYDEVYESRIHTIASEVASELKNI